MQALRLLVLTFGDPYKSIIAYVFFRITNLNNYYPKIEYSAFILLKDTKRTIYYSNARFLDEIKNA
jgi:hypothetical protein